MKHDNVSTYTNPPHIKQLYRFKKYIFQDTDVSFACLAYLTIKLIKFTNHPN